ncbi:unnamed protein product [Rhodiola kirilowii]
METTIITNSRSPSCSFFRGLPQPRLLSPPTPTPATFLPSFSAAAPISCKWNRTASRFNRFAHSSSTSDRFSSFPDFALLLEVEGVLMDTYRLGNRQAFNAAFQQLRLDCAKWTEPIYIDLARKSGGDEEKMVMMYFNKIGWPTSLPTSEKAAFVKSVLQGKKNSMDDVLTSESSPLRPGVEDFIDDAYDEGIPLVILTTHGKSGEKVARSVVGKLGTERSSKVKFVGHEEAEKSLYGQLVSSKMLSSDSSDQLATEALKAVSAEKQRVAEDVAALLKVKVDIDTTSTESLQKVVVALRAGAELAGVPVQNCIFIAGSQIGVAGAECVGIPCVVVRSSLTSRAEFSSVEATYDGFGGADLTIGKLQNKRKIHACAAITHMRGNIEDYVHQSYRKSEFRKAYEPYISPMPGPSEWPRHEGEVILPPMYKRQAGRPRRQRIREVDEPVNPNRKRKSGIIMTCSRCGKRGHNARRWKGDIADPRKAEIRKKDAEQAARNRLKSKTTMADGCNTSADYKKIKKAKVRRKKKLIQSIVLRESQASINEQPSRDWHTEYDNIGNDVPYERPVSSGPSQVQVRGGLAMFTRTAPASTSNGAQP